MLLRSGAAGCVKSCFVQWLVLLCWANEKTSQNMDIKDDMDVSHQQRTVSSRNIKFSKVNVCSMILLPTHHFLRPLWAFLGFQRSSLSSFWQLLCKCDKSPFFPTHVIDVRQCASISCVDPSLTEDEDSKIRGAAAKVLCCTCRLGNGFFFFDSESALNRIAQWNLGS